MVDTLLYTTVMTDIFKLLFFLLLAASFWPLAFYFIKHFSSLSSQFKLHHSTGAIIWFIGNK